MLRHLTLLSLLLAACGSEGPVAKYDVSADSSWGALPFPNDHYMRSGAMQLPTLPATTPVWEAVRTELNNRTGFCGTCPIHFPIKDGTIDPSTLANNVVLVDDAGASIPIEVQWDATASMISLQPQRGIVLESGRRYTAGLTGAITDPDGNALRADPGFTSSSASSLTKPARELLERAGIDGSIVATTTFTVEDPTLLAKDIAARVAGYYATNGAPQLTVTRVWKASDGSLDQLLGTPAAPLPGLDNPSLAGTVGRYAVTHERIAIAIKGTFNSVRVIENSGSQLGVPRADVVAGDNVPFLLIVPSGVDVTNLPVIVFHHGAGGVISQVFALGDLAGKAGAAVLALETFQHGERSPGATDNGHSLRGDDVDELGDDGFVESTTLTVALRLLAIDGAPEEHKASPLYQLATFSQMAAEYHSLLQVVQRSNLAPLVATDTSLTGLAFDQSRIFYLGLSLGTLIGATVLAADPPIAAGAFNVAVSSFAETLVESETFRLQFELQIAGPLSVPNEDYEPERKLLMQPLVGMMRWMQHPFEPLALAPHLARKAGRDLLWQIAGLDELAITPAGEGLVAAAGVPAIGEFPYATVAPGTAPLAGKGAYRFPQADHLMIAYKKGESALEPPGLPPFVRRSTKLVFENPIAQVHEQLTRFFQTRIATGTAEIR